MIPIWLDFGTLPLFELIPVLAMGLMAFFMQILGIGGKF